MSNLIFAILRRPAAHPTRGRLVAYLLFHCAIFQASGNRLAGRLFQTIHRAMLNMMMVTSQLVDLEHTLKFHQPILVAIEQRDPMLASRLMTDHLTDARDLLISRSPAETSRQLRNHLATGQSVHKRFRKSFPIAAVNKPNIFLGHSQKRMIAASTGSRSQNRGNHGRYTLIM
jgi:DNA-binding GntR family transcriptional regulator